MDRVQNIPVLMAIDCLLLPINCHDKLDQLYNKFKPIYTHAYAYPYTHIHTHTIWIIDIAVCNIVTI